MMESWRKVWRDGVAPVLTLDHLESLKTALETDDPRLLQGATTTPPPLASVQDWPVEAACAIGYCAVMEQGGFGEASVGNVEEFFARKCFDIDQGVNEPGGCRWFLNWFDETPREDMRRLLIPEVLLSIEGRKNVEKGCDDGKGTRPAFLGDSRSG